MLDCWIYCTPAAWDALASVETSDRWKYSYDNAVAGYWKTWQGTHEVYNILGSEATIAALVTQLGLDLVTGDDRVYAWTQGPATDDLDTYPTVPSEVLAVMKDHPVEGGPDIPATYENPNWGHIFLGQGERIYAGEFSGEFSTEFL